MSSMIRLVIRQPYRNISPHFFDITYSSDFYVTFRYAFDCFYTLICGF